MSCLLRQSFWWHKADGLVPATVGTSALETAAVSLAPDQAHEPQEQHVF